MPDPTGFLWEALKSAAKVAANVTGNVVGERFKGRVEDKLKPLLKLLESPQSRQAFDAAFSAARKDFVAGASTDEERRLRLKVVALLERTTRKGVDEASREVIQRYLLASDPDPEPLGRWVQRQLGGAGLAAGGCVYSQAQVTDALDALFRQLSRAFWDHPFFRRQISESDTNRLLRDILRALRPPVDLDELRTEYLCSLERRFRYLDLGGIAPKVANRTVKLPMKEIVVPIRATRQLDECLWSSHYGLAEQIGALHVRLNDLRCGVPEDTVKWLLSDTVAPIHPSQESDHHARLESLRNLLAHSVCDAGLDAWVAKWTPTTKIWLQGEDLEAFRKADSLDAKLWSWLQCKAMPTQAAGQEASIQDILAQPLVVLLGDPGTGKSTALKYAAYAIAARQPKMVGEAALQRLPILVRLAHYARSLTRDPTLCLRDYVRDVHDRDRSSLFRHALGAGDCVVLLDGLDEVANAQERTQVARQVGALVADYPENHYIITSRIVGYETARLTGDFSHFVIGPLPEGSIRTFVESWYRAIELEAGAEATEEVRLRAEELCKAIEDRPGIRRLAENPLLLTIVALVNWKGRKLPNHRAEVYRYAVETLVESWPRVHRGVAFDCEEVLSLLEPVAYRIFCDRSSEQIAEHELLDLLVQSTADTKPGMSPAMAKAYVSALLPRLSEDSGLFLERGLEGETGERLFGFLHLTFAEYLAARHLSGHWEGERDEGVRRASLARYAHVPRWREVVLLMAQQIGADGRRATATHFLGDVLQMGSPYEEWLHRDLLLAGQCLADDLRVNPDASDWVLDRLAALMLETPIEPLAEQIADIAQQMTRTAYAGALEQRALLGLDAAEPLQRVAAAEALGRMKSVQATDGLLERLKAEEPLVRSAVARALGKMKSERCVDELVTALEDNDAHVRADVAWALGTIGDCRAVDSLLRWVAAEQDNVGVRHTAADAFRGLKGEQEEDILLQRLRDQTQSIRCAAAFALEQVGSERAVPSLLECLGDGSPALRAAAATALGALGGAGMVEALLARLSDESESVRAAAVMALGRIKDERAAAGLLGRLQDKDETTDVRWLAAWHLSSIGDSRAEHALSQLLADSTEGDLIKSVALTSLTSIRSRNGPAALLLLLDDQNADVRRAAAWRLGEAKRLGATDELLRHLDDPSVDVRTAAARALGYIQSPTAEEGLVQSLHDECDEVRAAAARALWYAKGQRSADMLRETLHDGSALVRAAALWALGMIKCEAATDQMLQLLNDDKEIDDVRLTAAWALGRIAVEREVPLLLPWLLRRDLFFAPGTEYDLAEYVPICDWVYGTIRALLDSSARDPGVSFVPPSEPAVAGPWSQVKQ